MPELRKDPVIGRWVIIATERARRPGNIIDRRRHLFREEEKGPLKEIKFTGKKGQPWESQILSHPDALLSSGVKLRRRGKGLYDTINGYGFHDVIVDAPDSVVHMADLAVEQIQNVIETYAWRLGELEEKSEISHAFVYKNHGDLFENSGCSYSQILSSPVIPLHIMEKLDEAQRYFQFHERSVYVDIVREELSVKKRIIAESEHFLAFMPFASRFPFEICILPKEPHCHFTKGLQGKENDLAKILKDVLSRLKLGLDDSAYTMIINTAPFRLSPAEQTRWSSMNEDFSWHIDINPHLTRVAGFEKGTGCYICPVPPEKTAEFLRTISIL